MRLNHLVTNEACYKSRSKTSTGKTILWTKVVILHSQKLLSKLGRHYANSQIRLKLLRGSEDQTCTNRVVRKQAVQKVGKNKFCHTSLKYMKQPNKQRTINKAGNRYELEAKEGCVKPGNRINE